MASATADLTITYTVVDTPLGPFLLAGTETGLRHTAFLGGQGASRPDSGWVRDDERWATTADEIQRYFSGERVQFTTTLDPQGTAFQRSVWDALLAVPWGHTTTYGDVAKSLGKPTTASRAVGRANATNPLPLFIPCHRVIGSDGGLVGFRGGIRLKASLLQLESGGMQMDLF